jgi:MoaA/NifB/PqqE/SkfB family radical SAM enzyme
MCAQWSEEGYMINTVTNDSYSGSVVPFDVLLKVVDEVYKYGASLIIRGGELFLYPRIIELLAYIKSKSMPLSIETNGVLLKKYAEALVKLKVDNLLISLDGPEDIHDYVRGVKGHSPESERVSRKSKSTKTANDYKMHRGITCTLSGYNYRGLSASRML